MMLSELQAMTSRRSERWKRAHGTTWLLVPRLQKLVDDAWELEKEQAAGGCGDPVEDEQLRRLANSLLDAAWAVTHKLGHRAFVVR